MRVNFWQYMMFAGRDYYRFLTLYLEYGIKNQG